METVSIDVMQDPGVKHAWDKLQGFKSDFDELERRIVETNSRLTSLRNEECRGPLDRAAEALLVGTNVKDIEGDVAVLQGEYPKLVTRRAVVARAIELQTKVLKKEEPRASREICERIDPEYRAIVAGLAKSMIALGKAMMADITFFDALSGGGVMHGSLTRMNVTALGDPRERNSRLAMWLQEAITFGVIDETTVPADWRERWNK